MADQFGFWNAAPPDLVPLQRSFVENDEAAAGVNHALLGLFREHLAERLFDIHVLGAPHLGSFGLMRKTVNADGLALLSGEGEEEATRYLYRAWKGRNGNGRGLHFLRTYMQMLYPNQWSVAQMWQNTALPYTTGMQTEEELNSPYGPGQAGWVLTSRVRIGINYDAPLATSFGEMRKVLASVLPARFVPEFVAKAPTSVGDGSGAGKAGVGVRGIGLARARPPIVRAGAMQAGKGARLLAIARARPLVARHASMPRVSVVAAGVVVRMHPIPPDAWMSWRMPPRPLLKSTAGHAARAFVVARHRGAPHSVPAATQIGARAFVVARAGHMGADAWKSWGMPNQDGTVDDFYRGLITGYTTGQFPHWGDEDDGGLALLSLLNSGMLPF